MLDNYKATQIQRFCRGYLARQRAHQRLANIIKCQATVRRFLARRMFKRLKAEARTISHIQKMYKGLENKIIELQQRYDQISKENAALKKQNADIPEMRQKMAIMKQQENDLKALKLQLEQKDEKLLVVIKQLENERDEKMILLEEKQKEEEDRMKERAAMEQDLAKMREQVRFLCDWVEGVGVARGSYRIHGNGYILRSSRYLLDLFIFLPGFLQVFLLYQGLFQ